jgi:hypothetical protein
MTDLITRIGWDERAAESVETVKDSVRASINAEIEEMLAYMFFVDEAPLKEPVRGVSSFTKTFPERGPRDSRGRSLRDFDLRTRMFKYPLSYMVYSEAFKSLPPYVLERTYRRMYEILTGQDTSQAFARLLTVDRRNILEILRDTEPNLPSYWKTGAL